MTKRRGRKASGAAAAGDSAEGSASAPTALTVQLTLAPSTPFAELERLDRSIADRLATLGYRWLGTALQGEVIRVDDLDSTSNDQATVLYAFCSMPHIRRVSIGAVGSWTDCEPRPHSGGPIEAPQGSEATAWRPRGGDALTVRLSPITITTLDAHVAAANLLYEQGRLSAEGLLAVLGS
jgi:hypothetical protein